TGVQTCALPISPFENFGDLGLGLPGGGRDLPLRDAAPAQLAVDFTDVPPGQGIPHFAVLPHIGCNGRATRSDDAHLDPLTLWTGVGRRVRALRSSGEVHFGRSDR